MGTVAGSLTYDTKLDSNGFEKGLNGLSSTAVAIGNIMADVIQKVAQTVVEVTKMGVEYNAQIQTYQTALTTLLGSSEEANAVINQIKEDAKKTPFDVSGLVQGNQLLISAGISADQAREDILALGNAISATGGGNEELSRMSVNLQQIKNVGKASALDIKQFAYAGIDIYGLLADSMHITREEATNLDVTYEQLTGALKYASQEGGKYFGAMENQSKTFNGQLSNLKEAWQVFAGDAVKPLFDFLQNTGMPILNDLLSGNKSLEEIIPELIEILKKGIKNGAKWIKDNLPVFNQLGYDILTSLMDGIIEIIPDLIPLAVDIILELVDGLIDNFDKIIDSGIKLIGALIEGIFRALPRLIMKLPDLMNSLVRELARLIFISIPKLGLQIVTSLINGLFSGYGEMLNRVREFFRGTIFEGIVNRVVDMAEAGWNLVSGLWQGILNAKNWLENKIRGWVGNVTKFIKRLFGIRSPSRLFRNEIGKNLILGVGVAFEKDDNLIDRQIQDFSEDLTNKMQDAVNLQNGKYSISGTTGSVTDILTSNSSFTGNFRVEAKVREGTLFEAQERITANKNLQTSFSK